MYLEQIKQPADVKKLNIQQMHELAQEMRRTLLLKLSRVGGHFGPNFGMVEATIALHYVFDSPHDKMVFDVSHQSYPHKMLTGRKDAFLEEAHYGDVTGYSNPHESEHDFFTIGHTSTSVSLACGLAKARDLKGETGNVIAVIGDGSLSGGEALEGLDFAAELSGNLIILVNDNDMSIAENHGGLYQNLKLLRDTDGKAECNLFRAMGLDYLYVGDGNDVEALIQAFQQVKDSIQPIVVHINTLKGKGYAPAEQNKEAWHYCAPFNMETGEPLFPMDGESYESVSADFLMEKASKAPAVVMLTSGTPAVMGFTEDKRKQLGRQFIDVGIAEEHAVALASGIAAAGGKPVYGIYSTFIQRTYDQLSQDLCINGSPATLVTFWGSVFGMNDITHQGLQEIPMLNSIPGLMYLAPTTKEEYLAMLDWSIEQTETPVVIKLPGGPMVSDGKQPTADFTKPGACEVTQQGEKVAIFGLGTFYPLAVQAAKKIAEATGIQPTVIKPYHINCVDTDLLGSLKQNHSVILTLEDGILDGGFGEKLARYYGADSDVKVKNYGFRREFLDRFDPEQVLHDSRMTDSQIAEDAQKMLAK